jgi:hypothetical protein
LEFGEPRLKVHERHGSDRGLRRSAYVQGEWHLWIYCCHWKAKQDQEQLAWSEDTDELISRAADRLNGQKLIAVRVDPTTGRSSFTFDLGGSLETWPSGNDPTDEQWMVLKENEALAYRADGLYKRGPSDTLPDQERWLPLR